MSRRVRGGLLAAAGVALLLASSLTAQAPVQPGGVATVVAVAPALAPGDSVFYALDVTDGVRVFGRPTGRAAAGATELRLPFTFGLPTSAAAGRLVVARVALAWADGRQDFVVLAVNVAARREATFWLGAQDITVVPGTVVEVGYRLQNRGNAADSFNVVVDAPRGWATRLSPRAVHLAPGDTAAGTIRVTSPPTAGSGEEHVIRVGLRGHGVLESRSFRATVVGEEGWLGSLAHLPGTVFAGSSSDAGGMPALALEAAGEARPGMRVSLALRHADPLAVAPAFRPRLAGPRMRVGIETRGWDLRLGDLFTAPDLLSGPVSQGRGFEAQVRRGGGRAGLFVAAPLTYGLDHESGLMIQGSASRDTRHGRFGVRASSIQRRSELFGQNARHGAATSWSFAAPGHEVAMEAGYLVVSDTAGAQGGFAGQARWVHRFDAGNVTARLRKVPGTTRAGAGQGDEAFLSGTVGVTPVTTLLGWTYASASRFSDGSPYPVSRGGATGARFQLPRDIEAELIGTYRESWVEGDTLPTTRTRAVRLGLDVPVGAFTFETDADLGTSVSDRERPYRQLRAGARWAALRQWAWLGITHSDLGLGTPFTAADLTGSVQVRRVELQGGVSWPLDAERASPSLWSGATVPVARDTRIALGLDYRPATLASGWRVSLGISRSLGIPLPIARLPVVHGLVFEDLDGDRTRDPGEPLLQDIALLFGPLRTTTDAEGAFRFYDAARGSLRLDPVGLPAGFVVPAEVVIPSRGYVEIPVIRTAVLAIQIFLDRDGDSIRDDFEAFAAGAVVSLQGADGRTRDAAADDQGRLRFGSLAPGTYTALIYPQGSARQNAEPASVTFVVRPGETVEQLVAVPLRRREIRIQGGSPIDLPSARSQRH